MPYKNISNTAYIIADSLAKLSYATPWKEYISDEMRFLNKSFAHYAKRTFIKRIINLLPLPASIFIMDTFFIPGMTYHYLFRKLLIDKQLNKSLSDGVKQVIILGAGLDTLAIRKAKEQPGINFFEIDLPGTQNAKVEILNKIEYLIPSNCIFKPADLSNTKLGTILLEDNRFNTNAPTLIILEGVLMYLNESEVKNLFTDLYNLIDAKLIITFGAMTSSDCNKNWRVRIINSLLHRSNEETKWSCSSEIMPQFMAYLGYELQWWIPYKEIQNSYRSAETIKDLPTEDENYYSVLKMSKAA